MTYEFEREQQADSSAGIKGVKYLSVRASIKEDLQAIFELEKEVGQAVWSLHKLTSLLSTGVGQHKVEFAQAHTDLTELMDLLSERQVSLQKKLDDVTELTDEHLSSLDEAVSEFAKSFQEQRETLEKNWDRINAAIDAVLHSNGIDPRTLVQPNPEILIELRDAKVRRERWANGIIGAVVGLISTAILGIYARTVTVEQATTQAATKEILVEIKAIADSVKRQNEDSVKRQNEDLNKYIDESKKHGR